MNNYHEMNLSNFDFGDNLKILACHKCGRSVSVESTESGALLWGTLQVISQGDFFALHRYIAGDINLSISVGTSP